MANNFIGSSYTTFPDTSNLEKLIEDYEKYEKIVEKYQNLQEPKKRSGGNGYELGDGFWDIQIDPEKAAKEAEKAAKEAAAAAEKDHQELLKRELSDIEFAYKTNEIGMQEYIRRLENYRDTYLQDDVYAWRDTTLRIQDLRKKAADEEGKRLEEIAKAEEEARKKQIDNAQDFTDKIVSLVEQEANAKIAAIDAELAARNKLKDEQKQELQLQQAKAKLAFAKDQDSADSLRREIARLEESIQEKKSRQMQRRRKRRFRPK